MCQIHSKLINQGSCVQIPARPLSFVVTLCWNVFCTILSTADSSRAVDSYWREKRFINKFRLLGIVHFLNSFHVAPFSVKIMTCLDNMD